MAMHALLGAALLSCKKTPNARDGNVKALESSNGTSLLFALTLADETDVNELRTRMNATSAEFGLPQRSLPVCFFRASELSPEERAAFGTHMGSFSSLPRPLLATKVQALRANALDFSQANTLVDSLATAEGLSAEAVQALFSQEIVAASAVGVDDAKLTRFAEGLATRPVESPLVDFGDVSCAMSDIVAVLDGTPLPDQAAQNTVTTSQNGGVTLRTSGASDASATSPTLGLVNYTPLQRKGINILLPMFIWATNSLSFENPLIFGTQKGNFYNRERAGQISRTSERIGFASRAKFIPPLRGRPR
jgi:hypothetical protein